MIDLDEESLKIVKTILQEHLPGVEVKAFGSRVIGNAKQFSDLDLAVVGSDPVSLNVMRDLKFAFSNSDLPILIDVVDYHAVTPQFQEIITHQSESFS